MQKLPSCGTAAYDVWDPERLKTKAKYESNSAKRFRLKSEIWEETD